MPQVNPAQVEKFLKGINYPASKSDLLKHVEKNGASEQVRTVMSQLPDQRFNSAVELNKAISTLEARS